jgi:hypothetical protein
MVTRTRLLRYTYVVCPAVFSHTVLLRNELALLTAQYNYMCCRLCTMTYMVRTTWLNTRGLLKFMLVFIMCSYVMQRLLVSFVSRQRPCVVLKSQNVRHKNTWQQN